MDKNNDVAVVEDKNILDFKKTTESNVASNSIKKPRVTRAPKPEVDNKIATKTVENKPIIRKPRVAKPIIEKQKVIASAPVEVIAVSYTDDFVDDNYTFENLLSKKKLKKIKDKLKKADKKEKQKKQKAKKAKKAKKVTKKKKEKKKAQKKKNLKKKKSSKRKKK